MDVLKYVNEIIFTYSSLGQASIFRIGIIFLSIALVFEAFSFIFISISQKRWRSGHKQLFLTLFQSVRVFIRFLLLYLFLTGIKASAAVQYPLNLIYRGFELGLLGAGLISALLRLGKGLRYTGMSTSKGSLPEGEIKNPSLKRVRLLIVLLVFSLVLSRLKQEFISELQTVLWISIIVVINSILLLVSFFLAVDKILPQIQIYLNEHFPSGFSRHFFSIISGPLKFLIITLFLLTLKPVFTGQPQLMAITVKVMEISASAAIIILLFNLLDIFVSRLSKYSELDTNSLDKTLIEMIRMIIKVCFIAAFIFLTIRVITGKPLTTLLAGLGIGGLAVALAAQDTLKNFFGSIMIMTDKPFKVGERIIAEGYDGTIESIGFRSTRIRTLTGHQVVIPNDKVAQSSIENIGRRQSIRRLTNITVTYGTSPEKMERALSIIRELLDNHEGMIPDMPPRVYFNEFNADSLNILVLYWYAPPDYWAFMRFAEEVNLNIMKQFAAEGIEFAFPTFTTYIEQEDGKSIKLDINDSQFTERSGAGE